MARSTKPSGRALAVRHALPALAIMVLAVGLAACQTPPRGSVAPAAQIVLPDPQFVGAQFSRSAERVNQLQRDIERAHQLAAGSTLTDNQRRREIYRFADPYELFIVGVPHPAYVPTLTDRISAQIAQEKITTVVPVPKRFNGIGRRAV